MPGTDSEHHRIDDLARAYWRRHEFNYSDAYVINTGYLIDQYETLTAEGWLMIMVSGPYLHMAAIVRTMNRRWRNYT